MTKNAMIASLAALLLTVSLCVSCTPGIHLNTQRAHDSDVKGIYSVIFYGCNFFEDFETIAFLDKEGDQYSFEPFAPDFKYRVKKGMAATEALAAAKEFVSCNTAFRRAQLSGVIAPNGEILGYEVRPLYDPFTFGFSDVLYTYYWMKGDKVVITIKLDPSMERMLRGGGPGRER